MSVRLRAAYLVVALLVATTGCSGSTSDGSSGRARDQAVERSRDLGLTKDQATCVVDRLGAATVVEAGDLSALAQGGPYRDAAAVCTRGS